MHAKRLGLAVREAVVKADGAVLSRGRVHLLEAVSFVGELGAARRALEGSGLRAGTACDSGAQQGSEGAADLMGLILRDARLSASAGLNSNPTTA